MSRFRASVRRLLARRGYSLTRVEPEIPPCLSQYLRSVQSRTTQPLSVICFDNEVAIQSQILDVFPADRTFFSCPPVVSYRNPLGPDLIPSAQTGRFIAFIDIEMLAVEISLKNFPWLRRAEALLLGARLGIFWSGELDACNLSRMLKPFGFYLADVVGSSQLSHLHAPAERTILAYERTAARPSSLGLRYRANEAAAYLSAPVVRRGDFRLLAGRGSFGFAAGVHNPGAIVADDRTYLLPRADRTAWALQKTDESLFFTSSQPLLLTLGDDGCVASAAELSTVGLPEPGTTRTGDFRLFRFGSRIFTNHFVMSSPRQLVARRVLQIDALRTRVGLSELDLGERQLVWRGFPSLDRPLARAEKNWAMFTDGTRLLLLYSFDPFILLVANRWPALDFATVVEARVTLPFAGDGLPLRNSVNPVDYDDAHWLHIVHKVYPSKQYAFWAVLLDKQTLRPVQVTARPLVCGWQSYAASIIYVCSVIVDPVNVILFSGLDDSATAFAKIPRCRLDAEWIPVEGEHAHQPSGMPPAAVLGPARFTFRP